MIGGLLVVGGGQNVTSLSGLMMMKVQRVDRQTQKREGGCKFFEWINGEDGKLTFNRVLGATRREGASTGDVFLGGAQPVLGRFDVEISKLEAQERKIERLRVEIERLNVKFGQIDTCVGRLCGELNVVQEQVERFEDNMKKHHKRQFMILLFFVILILALFVGRI
ncbi:hypothetical protein PIB30_047913 [Stylosanthes scabra]|uniref:Bet1-like protein n=1 Tax=Stylosanthes scabra TaxID=79078 RepID=A0ABU6THI1_9FABA|nr:hypothetical protein [Stylosanthes scabra]